MKSKIERLLESYVECTEFWMKRYRESLMDVGKSPDYHIYDLEEDWLLGLPKSPSRTFLLRLVCFYECLDPLGKIILVREVLEQRRHYQFWFLGIQFARGEFERRKYEVLSTFARRFNEPARS